MSVASPTGRVEGVRREAPNGGPAFAPAHHLQHPYRPFTARMEADLILSYLISYLFSLSILSIYHLVVEDKRDTIVGLSLISVVEGGN
jgi:hypothetical protein